MTYLSLRVCLRLLSSVYRLERLSWTDLMKEYRKLDDSITMRLNRTTAQYRDMDRTGSAGKGTIEDQACLQVWRELVGPCIHPSHNHGPFC